MGSFTYLTGDFVERRIGPLASVPESWEVHSQGGIYYELDLKMCQIKTLLFDFEWGKEKAPLPRLVSLLDRPSRILRIDLSLNELTTLKQDGFLPFRNLRSLDVSLNQIQNYQGVEVLQHLCSLNLSHNAIRSVDGLISCRQLVDLNLSNNELRDMSAMPSLLNLRRLDVSSNKLDSLDGLSSLPKLEELNCQRNRITDIVPVTGCFQLRILNAAENGITDFEKTLNVLKRLKWLNVLSLFGNPIERERHYQADVLQACNVMTLDNVSLRPLPRRSEESERHVGNLVTLKDAARQAFEERMRAARRRMDENVAFLQRRILKLQEEHREFEMKLKNDLDVCLRYLDTLTEEESGQAEAYPEHHLRPWDEAGGRGSRRGGGQKEDYKDVKDTDELLRCAYKELAISQSRLDMV